MQIIRLQQLVEKVTLLQTGPNGTVEPVVLCSREGKKSRKKKGSGMGMAMAEDFAERLVKAQKAFADTLNDKFCESQRKKTNGWLFELPANVMKAGSAAAKKIRVYRIPG